MVTNQKGKETGKLQTSCPPQHQAQWEWCLNGSQNPDSFGLPALVLAVNTLHTEGLYLCLHAEHHIGHFVQPRVSNGVHDQIGEEDIFELELGKENFVLTCQQTYFFNSFGTV